MKKTCSVCNQGIAALGDKAKKNQLAVEDMDGGTFTISNGGVFGSLFGRIFFLSNKTMGIL